MAGGLGGVAQLTAAPMPISLAQLLGRDGGGGAHGGRASGSGKLQEMLGTLQPLDFAERRLLPQEKEKARVPGPFARDSRSTVESSVVGPTPNPDAAASIAKRTSAALIQRCRGSSAAVSSALSAVYKVPEHEVQHLAELTFVATGSGGAPPVLVRGGLPPLAATVLCSSSARNSCAIIAP